MTGNQFKSTLKRLRLQQKQFAIMNDMTVQGINKWIRIDQVPRWASEKLIDWEKHPDLIADNMSRSGLITE